MAYSDAWIAENRVSSCSKLPTLVIVSAGAPNIISNIFLWSFLFNTYVLV